MNVLFLLKEHGDLTFEELADTMGAGTDYIDLQVHLTKLEEEGRIRSYTNESDRKLYSLSGAAHERV